MIGARNGTPTTLEILFDSGWNTPPSLYYHVQAAGENAVSQVFTFTYGDFNGHADIDWGEILFARTPSSVNACYLLADYTHRKFYLADDAGTSWMGPLAEGAAGSLSNSQCTLQGVGSSFAGNGLQLKVTVNLTFKPPAFSGLVNLFQRAMDLEGNDSDWWSLGDFYRIPALP
jgi:hypothetical protein